MGTPFASVPAEPAREMQQEARRVGSIANLNKTHDSPRETVLKRGMKDGGEEGFPEQYSQAGRRTEVTG